MPPSSSSSSSSSSDSSSSSSSSDSEEERSKRRTAPSRDAPTSSRGHSRERGNGGSRRRSRSRERRRDTSRRRSRSPPRHRGGSRSPPRQRRREGRSRSPRGQRLRRSRSRDRSHSRGGSDGRGRGFDGPSRPRAVQHKLFVGGLSFDTRDEGLRVAFAVFGEVCEAKVIMDREDPTRSRGFGFVTMGSEDAMVSAAASLNSTELDGRTISVRLESDGRPEAGSRAPALQQRVKHEAFVGGLAWSTTDESLRAAFARFGDIVGCKVVMDKDEPTKSRGFGFVNFASAEMLDQACSQMDGTELEGRTIRVNKADGGASGGGGSGGGANAIPLGGGVGRREGNDAGDELAGVAYADRFGPGESAADGAPSAPKEEANYGLSGKLAAETNTYRGVVLKFSEPPEARMPAKRWRLYIFKGEEQLEPLRIYKQSFFLCGKDRQVADIPTDHPSCSRQHAVIQYRQITAEDEFGAPVTKVKPYLMDLESTNGTFINDVRLEPRRYYEILEKDVLKFGNSTRKYVLLHPESKDSDSDDG